MYCSLPLISHADDAFWIHFQVQPSLLRNQLRHLSWIHQTLSNSYYKRLWRLKGPSLRKLQILTVTSWSASINGDHYWRKITEFAFSWSLQSSQTNWPHCSRTCHWRPSLCVQSFQWLTPHHSPARTLAMLCRLENSQCCDVKVGYGAIKKLASDTHRNLQRSWILQQRWWHRFLRRQSSTFQVWSVISKGSIKLVNWKCNFTYRSLWIIRQPKTLLFAHSLEAPAAPMNSILCQKESNRQDDESKKAKDCKCSKCTNPKEWVHFMLDVSNNCNATEFALLLHWTAKFRIELIDTLQ